jgi:hypothetical protein
MTERFLTRSANQVHGCYPAIEVVFMFYRQLDVQRQAVPLNVALVSVRNIDGLDLIVPAVAVAWKAGMSGTGILMHSETSVHRLGSGG